VIRVEQRRIIQCVFDGDKVQVQGLKFHALLYKPYDDDPSLAWNSVLAGIALHYVTTQATPQVFENYPKLDSVIGQHAFASPCKHSIPWIDYFHPELALSTLSVRFLDVSHDVYLGDG
jgi:hypothetical protein